MELTNAISEINPVAHDDVPLQDAILQHNTVNSQDDRSATEENDSPKKESSNKSHRSLLPWLLGGAFFLFCGSIFKTPSTATSSRCSATSYHLRVGQWQR
jgi:hypothetical protein